MASGRGSNAKALLEAFRSGQTPGCASVLISDQEGAACLEVGSEFDVPSFAITKRGRSKQEHEKEILKVLAEYGVHHILLAGYMRILSSEFIDTFQGTILNIHPSLLPDFKGINTAERQIQSKVKVSGATVHEVVADVDSGPVILQGALEVHPQETPESLSNRILTEIEHDLYPRAVWLFTARTLGHIEE